MYKPFNKVLLAGVTFAVASLVSTNLLAESDTTIGSGSISAAANLDFRIIIPSFLYFRVGTAGATIDQVTFDLSSGSPVVGDGTDVAGTGGDLGAGAVTARVRSNAGQITITESNNSGGSGLSDGGTNTISYAEILSSSSDATDLDAPTLSDAGGGTSTPTLNGGNITNRLATWTYTYDNAGVYEAGTYGTSANGGRVTYTAANP